MSCFFYMVYAPCKTNLDFLPRSLPNEGSGREKTQTEQCAPKEKQGMISGLRNPSIFACTGNFRVLWRSNVRNCVSVFTHDTRCQVCRCAWRFRRCLRIRTLRDIGRRRDVRRRGDIGRCGLRIGNDISVCHISADRAAVSFYSDFLYLIVDFVSVPVAKLRKVREAGFPFVLIGEGQAVFFYTVCKEKDFYLIGTFPNPTLFYEKGPSGNILDRKSVV